MFNVGYSVLFLSLRVRWSDGEVLEMISDARKMEAKEMLSK